MAPVADRSTTAHSSFDVVSPELALVDPVLRAAALERLADPGHGPAGRVAATRAARQSTRVPGQTEGEAWAPADVAEAAARRLAESALAAEAAMAAEAPALLPRRLPRMTVIVAAASAGFAVALLAADRALERQDGRLTSVAATAQPAVADGKRATAGRRPAVTPSTPPRRSAAAPIVAPQRFAWAPVAGATGYHVELYRGPARVYAADTNRPTLTIPSGWRFAGRRYRLEAVEYRWYVWPILSGRRTAKAVVQARLVVRDR